MSQFTLSSTYFFSHRIKTLPKIANQKKEMKCYKEASKVLIGSQYNIKREISDKKIKVEKSVLNLCFLSSM